MEILRLENPEAQGPQVLSPCSSRRRSSDSNSPEFEFWRIQNPSFPEPNLLSADELFVDGVLLPLQLLHFHPRHHSDDTLDNPFEKQADTETGGTSPISDPTPDPELPSEPATGPQLFTAETDPSANSLTASKRWKRIFQKSDRKISNGSNNYGGGDGDSEKEKKKDKKGSSGGGGAPAQLNINIWPFFRSRSAGNGRNRPRMVAGSAATRKASSAPCSRSNSAGESKSRKWPSSPSRGGVHLGRSSPVWQMRRGVSAGPTPSDPAVIRTAEKWVQKEPKELRRKKAMTASTGVGGPKARVLSLNVPMRNAYRQNLSCRSDDGSSAVSLAAVGDGNSGGSDGQSSAAGSTDGGRGSNLFNLRNLFAKKVH